jgi:hypothetical protein
MISMAYEPPCETPRFAFVSFAKDFVSRLPFSGFRAARSRLEREKLWRGLGGSLEEPGQAARQECATFSKESCAKEQLSR